MSDSYCRSRKWLTASFLGPCVGTEGDVISPLRNGHVQMVRQDCEAGASVAQTDGSSLFVDIDVSLGTRIISGLLDNSPVQDTAKSEILCLHCMQPLSFVLTVDVVSYCVELLRTATQLSSQSRNLLICLIKVRNGGKARASSPCIVFWFQLLIQRAVEPSRRRCSKHPRTL